MINFLAGTTEEAGQGQDRVCLRAGVVSMEKGTFWSLQRHGHISTIDGTRIDRCNKEIRQPGNVICGWRGNCDADTRRSYRTTSYMS